MGTVQSREKGAGWTAGSGRELLTDHRVPGLLLEAMKVAVKKQRKKIKAKMLGIPEEAESR